MTGNYNLTCDLDYLREQTFSSSTTFFTPFGLRYLTYADYIASGRNLKFVEEYILSLQHTYANTHTEDDLTGKITTELLHQAEDLVKKAVNGNENTKLIAVGSGATGAVHKLQEILGVAIPPATHEHLESWLKGMKGETVFEDFSEHYRKQRPVVFIGPYEHHSNEISWRESLCEIVSIPKGANDEFDLEAMDSIVSDPRWGNRTKIGSFSAASNVTGQISPVYDIARIMHKHGGIVAFDYAASAPYVEIDMNRDKESYFDAIFFSPHKFIGGPGSSGILLINDCIYPSHLPPTVAGGGTVHFVSPDNHTFVEDIEDREKAGTPGSLQVMKVALAFMVKEAIGVETIGKIEHDYIARAMGKFANDKRVEVLGHPDPAKRLSVLSFNINHGEFILHPKYVTRLLNDLFGIQSRAGCSCAGPYGHTLLGIDKETSEKYSYRILKGYGAFRPGWVRVGFHFTLTDADFEFICNAIEFVAEHGHLFLPDYSLDITTGTWYHNSQKEENSPTLSLQCAITDQIKSDFDPTTSRPIAYREYMSVAVKLAQDREGQKANYYTFEPEFEEIRFFEVVNLTQD